MGFASLGFELLASVVACGFIGYWLDRWLETAPWLLVGGLLLGGVVGLWSFFRRVWPRANGGGSAT